MQFLPAPLAAMGRYRQFLCYQLVPSVSRPGRMEKEPISPHTLYRVDAHEQAHWSTFEHASQIAQQMGQGYGVAFVFTEQDPFFFIDIDHCRDPQTGAYTPFAMQVVSMFPGAAIEISASGQGLHIFGCGAVGPHSKKRDDLSLEFYTEKRFAALTGYGAQGDVWTDHSASLQWLASDWFRFKGDANGDHTLTDGPVPEWKGPADDADLIRRALQSRSAAGAFGGGASFADLWEANMDALGRAFPPDNAHDPYNRSRADAALASHLAFWTGRDGVRIERLMRQSALVREKWDRGGDDYLARTITEICARPGDVLTDREAAPSAVAQDLVGQIAQEAPAPTRIEGNTLLFPDHQIDLFRGCVYVQNVHRALTPGGFILKADQFRVAYGGYSFVMDADNQQRPTRDAWEAFTQSQVLRAPRAHGVCFRPDLPPGVLVNDAGRKYANTFWPAEIERKVGDASPFLNHLRLMLPNERDYELVLAYMCACVQYPGRKFRWWPVIQGTEGNGKTTLSVFLSYALGHHYVHWPHSDDLASPFNGYLSNQLFIAVEELYNQESQAAVIQKLMQIIAGGIGVQIQFKGVDQMSQKICCNGLCTTNFKGAVRKTADTGRRFGVFYTAHQSYADLVRDGIHKESGYWGRFWQWAEAGGFAIISELLHTRAIPREYDPLYMDRAPDTSTSDMVVRESRGSVEQAIAEAVATDTVGFMGGWVSSTMLDKLLTDTLRARMSHSKRREMMASLGYVLHPHLPDGRPNNPVSPDGRKSQLYLLQNHPALMLTTPSEIAKAYTAAQTVAPVALV